MLVCVGLLNECAQVGETHYGDRLVFKITSCNFTLFYSYFYSIKCLFLEMCLVRRTIAYLCPIMIHFNALDFNECRSEEVISLFWRSVLHWTQIGYLEFLNTCSCHITNVNLTSTCVKQVIAMGDFKFSVSTGVSRKFSLIDNLYKQ